jgi:hypothetical protein
MQKLLGSREEVGIEALNQLLLVRTAHVPTRRLPLRSGAPLPGRAPISAEGVGILIPRRARFHALAHAQYVPLPRPPAHMRGARRLTCRG